MGGRVEHDGDADPATFGRRRTITSDSSSLSAVQVDHVVALVDGWQKDAQQLTAEERADMANDPSEPLAR